MPSPTPTTFYLQFTPTHHPSHLCLCHHHPLCCLPAHNTFLPTAFSFTLPACPTCPPASPSSSLPATPACLPFLPTYCLPLPSMPPAAPLSASLLPCPASSPARAGAYARAFLRCFAAHCLFGCDPAATVYTPRAHFCVRRRLASCAHYRAARFNAHGIARMPRTFRAMRFCLAFCGAGRLYWASPCAQRQHARAPRMPPLVIWFFILCRRTISICCTHLSVRVRTDEHA